MKAVSFSVNINEVNGIVDDIRAYVDDRLDDINIFHELEKGWAGDPRKREFCSCADGLFVWVAVASKFIMDSWIQTAH